MAMPIIQNPARYMAKDDATVQRCPLEELQPSPPSHGGPIYRKTARIGLSNRPVKVDGEFRRRYVVLSWCRVSLSAFGAEWL